MYLQITETTDSVITLIESVGITTTVMLLFLGAIFWVGKKWVNSILTKMQDTDSRQDAKIADLETKLNNVSNDVDFNRKLIRGQ